MDLISKGSADQAEKICRNAIEENPRDVNMTALLGATLLKSRQWEEAEKFLRLAIQPAGRAAAGRGSRGGAAHGHPSGSDPGSGPF
jgi:uncharacterized protein HemY